MKFSNKVLGGMMIAPMLLTCGQAIAGPERDPLTPRVPEPFRDAAKADKSPLYDTAANAPATIVAEGKALYESKGVCINCHGRDGDGRGPAGAVLNPGPRDFTNCEFHQNREDGELMWVIKNGSPGTGMVSLIPATISEEEAWKIIAYERSFCDALSEGNEEPTKFQTLEVTKAGPGIGTVTSTPSGISCPGDCSETYVQGTDVTLSPVAGPLATFAGWSGGECTGTALTCRVTMDADRAVTATFNLTFTNSNKNSHDLNGDGKSDIVWRNRISGIVAVWLMNGTTINSSGFPAGVSSDWQVAGVGDVNGDGKADVIWRNGTSGVVAVWVMDGLSITSVGFPGSASTDWDIEQIGDVDGNGTEDIVWQNSNSGVVAVWLMNGASIESSGFLGGVPAAWQMTGIGDVNSDGKADVIWRNSTSGTVAIWVMEGLTISSVGFPGSAPTEFEIAGIGDIDGNGTTDVVWRNMSNGAVVVWLLNGTTMSSSGFLAGKSLEWKIAQVGDTDGDGKADVIWFNTSTGAVEVWLMNEVAIAFTGSPGATSTEWEIQ